MLLKIEYPVCFGKKVERCDVGAVARKSIKPREAFCSIPSKLVITLGVARA